MKQSTIDWEMSDKYHKLCNLEIEVNSILWPVIRTYKKAKIYQY